MTERSVEEILADWRAAEAEGERGDSTIQSVELAARIEQLRGEYAAAVAARADEAHELGAKPAFPTEPVPSDVQPEKVRETDRQLRLPFRVEQH